MALIEAASLVSATQKPPTSKPMEKPEKGTKKSHGDADGDDPSAYEGGAPSWKALFQGVWTRRLRSADGELFIPFFRESLRLAGMGESCGAVPPSSGAPTDVPQAESTSQPSSSSPSELVLSFVRSHPFLFAHFCRFVHHVARTAAEETQDATVRRINEAAIRRATDAANFASAAGPNLLGALAAFMVWKAGVEQDSVPPSLSFDCLETILRNYLSR
jgi:hypothetical protein